MIPSPPFRKLRAGALPGALALLLSGAAFAAPTSVTLVGSVQTKLGCSGSDTSCAGAQLKFDTDDQAWEGSFTLDAGTYTFRAAVDESGSVTTYGKKGAVNGDEFSVTTDGSAPVKFYYDAASHWVTTRTTAVLAVAAGSFQSELGCPGDWSPDCLRSWLTDVDGDGVYSFITTAIPKGSYAFKVALNEGWAESYPGSDYAFTVSADGVAMDFEYEAASHKVSVKELGAPSGNISQARSHFVSGELLVWSPDVTSVPSGSTYRLHYDPTGAMTLGATGVSGGQSIVLSIEAAGLPAEIAAKFPQLAGRQVLRIADADLIKVKDLLKGQLALSVVDPSGKLLDATGIQLPGVLDTLYANDEALGVTWSSGTPTVRLWAPTARTVTLHVYGDSTTASDTPVTMALEAGTGVWSATGSADWKGKYYLFEVEVYVPSSKAVVKPLVTDPYSLSLSTNSTRSQFVDLADPALAPTGWSSLIKPALAAPEDIVLYELHLRDFSINDTGVAATNRGTYLAFTDPGSNGMKHLKSLAAQGLTHVHLLPLFDIATIEEVRANQKVPAGDLSKSAPDSEEQQAAVNAVKDQDGFNWGYDPYHYTTPEGSYATNPEGSVRIVEFRRMVKALSDSGLRVVMDVVYNHTDASGLADKSVLDKVVPGYYQRLDDFGNVATSTCCQNTASEHAMFEKLMVDSLLVWAKYYKVDGFRFDLMGHHMKANMVKIQDKLHALTVDKDGVDGSKIYLYGEGWNFGEVANNARGVNATQLNMGGTGIGTFSDRMRDAARGGDPFGDQRKQGFINGLWDDDNGSNTQGDTNAQLQQLLSSMDMIRLGLAGNLANYTFEDNTGKTVKGSDLKYGADPAGYTLDPQEVITYVSAHDNQTLFDAVQIKASPTADIDARVRMHNMGMSLVALGQGIPFFHAGDELLRSKSLDNNSYNSGDWFNKLDFTYASNNWGVGAPPSPDNTANWGIMKPLLANPKLKQDYGGTNRIPRALNHFGELLRIRKSTGLFRLRTAADVQAHVKFLNTGTRQIPGVIVMNLHDDAATDGITDVLVFFNATQKAKDITFPEYKGRGMRLHPVQQASDDNVFLAGTAKYVQADGTFTVAGRTTTVFINTPATTPGTDGGTMPGGDGGTMPGADGGTDGGTTPGMDAGTQDDGGILIDPPCCKTEVPPKSCGCAGTGGEALGMLALVMGGLLRSRRRSSRP